MVIWLLGMSGVGKTTIGTMLEEYIAARGAACYRVDGDEIRDFFDRDLGYSLEDRAQNMKRLMLGAYLLSKNEIVTIVCAVTPVETWRVTAREKISDYFEIYLKREIDKLRKNDIKGIYASHIGKTQIAGIDFPFDEPLHSDLTLDTGIMTEQETFAEVKLFVDKLIEKRYWQVYYRRNPLPAEPSQFSSFALNYIDTNYRSTHDNISLVELGCGNGRDSIYFACNHMYVTGIDQVSEEISFLNDKYGGIYPNLEFTVGDFTASLTTEQHDGEYDVIYSRFTWHSITESAEERLLSLIECSLKPDGLLFIEARSINDNLFEQGTIISKNERITDHYRRFMDLELFLPKLNKHKLRVLEQTESTGLAVCGNEDPVIIRLVITKEI